ncbi:MAG: UTRA domain-containing protein, partial [Pseudonocardiaceae bacterium]
GDRVRQVQETWLPPHVAEGNALAKQSLRGHTKITGGIYGGLVAEGHTPATGVEIVFSRMPTRSEAEIMGLRLGSPVTDVRRTTRDSAGVVIVHTHLVLSGDHVQLVYPQTL